jgi:hypothetical protein
MEIPLFIFAQAMLCVAGFPAHMTFAVDRLSPPPEDQVYYLVEKLMSDKLMPFAKLKISLMSYPKRRSLCQEPNSVTTSSRRMILSSKSDIAGVIGGRRAINPYEKESGAVMDRPRILSTHTKYSLQKS